MVKKVKDDEAEAGGWGMALSGAVSYDTKPASETTDEQEAPVPESAPIRQKTADEPVHDAISNAADAQLISYVERMERLDEERKAITDDMKEVMAEAKGNGFDAPMIRKVLQRRKMDPNTREEQDALLELYEGITAKMPSRV